MEIKSDFSSGDHYHLNIELKSDFEEIAEIYIAVDGVFILPDGGMATQPLINGTYGMRNGKVELSGKDPEGYVKSYVITHMDFFVGNRKPIPVRHFSGEEMKGILDNARGKVKVADHLPDNTKEQEQSMEAPTIGAEPLKTWLNEEAPLLLITEQDKLSIMNLNTYEKTLISRVTSEWIDKQPYDGFSLTLDFTDETGGLISYINAGASFYEEDRNRGGQTNNFETSGKGFSNVRIADQKDLDAEYHVTPIMGWAIWLDEIDLRIGNSPSIKVYDLAVNQRRELNLWDGFSFIGDRNNPFSIIKHSGKAPESWHSEFRKVDLLWQDNMVTAVNKETGETKDLVLISTTWQPSLTNTGEFIFTFEDLSGGLVTGGSLSTTFTFGEYLPRGNQAFGAFRFDGGDTVSFYKYIAGKKPSLVYSLTVVRPENFASPLRETFGTLVFRDGNVLLFHPAEGW